MNTRMIQKGAQSMRIIALPLARVKVSQDAKSKACPNFNANTVLVYYHFDLISPSGGHEGLSWHKKVLNSAMNKATALWTSLGKAPKGSWKLWTYEMGERVADRIDFEELTLRNVDPSLGPTVPLTGTNITGRKSRNRLHSPPKIPLIYPSSLYPTTGAVHALHPSLTHLQTLLASRSPRHRKGFYLWMLIAPFTVPIILIPVMPNLPLFFCVWRSWSHYRAYRSSEYLSSLLDHGLIESNPSLELDKLYVSSTSSSEISQSLPSATLASRSSEKKSPIRNVADDRKSEAASGTRESRSEILLTPKAIPHILGIFRLPESTTINICRAIDQARGRLGNRHNSTYS